VELGAGWRERVHAAYGVPFPRAPERLDAVEGTDTKVTVRDLPTVGRDRDDNLDRFAPVMT